MIIGSLYIVSLWFIHFLYPSAIIYDLDANQVYFTNKGSGAWRCDYTGRLYLTFACTSA